MPKKVYENQLFAVTIIAPGESVKMMRGKPKTSLVLTIIRKGEPKPLEIKIVRDIIKIQSVYTKTIEDKILYVHVTSFDQKVVEGVQNAMKEHNATKGMILDLRNNPGGLLDQAVGLVDLFVEEGVIVSQKGTPNFPQLLIQALAIM